MRPVAVVVSVILVWLVAEGAAQQRPFAGASSDEYTPDGSENQAHDGRFQFVRLRYPYLSGYGRRGGLAPWAHDHPRGDVHYMRILSELTLLRTRTTGSNVFSIDDPDLMQFPFAYMSEPGFWRPTDAEVAALRTYLLKGGFVVFDDFRGADWDNLRAQMARVFPDRPFVELTGEDAIFHAFFEIPDPLVLDPPYGGLPPAYYGVFDGAAPGGRLMAIADVNNDLSEYWEFSDTGYAPVDESNEAYKFGVNYAMYAVTH